MKPLSASLARRVLLLALAYFIVGTLGLQVASVAENVTLMWLPAGIAVAALYHWGNRLLAGVWLGSVGIGLAVGTPLWVALMLGAANAVAPLATVWMLRRGGFHPSFARGRDILLLAVAATVGMVASATIGVAALAMGGLRAQGIGTAWLFWWAGDVMGVLTVAPLVLSASRDKWRSLARRRVEAVSLVSAIALMGWGVFMLNGGAGGRALSVAFLPFPLIAWAALRFGPSLTSLAVTELAVVAASGTASNTGPFAGPDPVLGSMLLLLFIATSAALGWLITALQSAMHQATSTRRQLEQALDDAALGVLLGAPDRTITYANAGFTSLTGYSRGDMVGGSCRVLQGPGTDAEVAGALAAALHEGRRFEGDILNYRKDGTPFWNSLLISPLQGAPGELMGFLGVLRDATARKQAEDALQESRARLDGIVNSIDDVVYSTSPDGGSLLYLSDAARVLYGRSAGEFMANPMRWLAVIHPDDQEAADQAFHGIAHTGTFDAEYRIMRGDGAVRWVHDRGRIVHDVAGRALRFDGVVSDITDRKQATEALREGAERLRLALSATNQGLYDLNVKTGEAIVSDEYARMLGYEPATFHETNAAWRERLHPEDAERTVQAYTDYVEGKLPEYRVEFRQRTKAGDWRWIQSLGGLVARAADGTPLRMLGTHTDITARKRAEAVSAAERDVLELLSSGVPLAEALTRLALGFEAAYPTARCSVLLLESGGTYLRHVAAPHLPEAFRRALDRVEVGPTVGACGAAAFNRRLTQAEDVAVDPNWTDYRALALANGLRACASLPIVSSNNDVLGTFAVYREVPHLADAQEITSLERCARFAALAIERHQLLRSLDESRTRLQTLVVNLPGMAYRCVNDAAWTMSFVSEGCEALTGYRRDELEGNRVIAYGDLVHPEDREWLWAKCQASLDARTPCQNEYRLIDRQGREHWVSERASGQYDASGALLCIDGFIQDITEGRRVALERAQLERKMLETQKLESLGVLAGGIAHDFNNILTGILGNASLGATEVAPGAPAEDYFQDIAESARRAADLCRQMLAYAGKGRFVLRNLDLSHLVETTTQMLQLSISKSAVLRYQLARDLPPIEVDATQIRQVIMNLVINASEAIGERSGVISISTGLTHVDSTYLAGTMVSPDLPAGDYVFLEVSDSGVGMSPEVQARIFDPFFSTKFTGRGLGLAAVLGIVRGHKGALKLYSEPGRGTTFKLLFPAVGGPSEPALPSVDPAGDWRGSGTVLIVDDEETVRSTAARMLRRMGFEVAMAADGLEALEAFRADPDRFSVVLLDLTMPHRNGEQTFAELRQLRSDVRVVLMSGFSEQEALVRFPGKGLASFLQKPFSNDALRNVVRAALHREG